MSDPELRRALELARRRLAESLPSSPEWAAAIEAVEELEAELASREARSLRRLQAAS